MMLNQCRYWFRWQCPVRNRESNTTCFRFSFPYSLSPVVVPGIDSYCVVFLHFLFPFSILSPIWFWSWFVSIYYVPLSFLFLGVWCWKWPRSLLPDLLVHFPRYLYVLIPI